jgi:hypothetical protein
MCMYVYVCRWMYEYVYVRMCMCMCMCMCVYVYVYVHVHVASINPSWDNSEINKLHRKFVWAPRLLYSFQGWLVCLRRLHRPK